MHDSVMARQPEISIASPDATSHEVGNGLAVRRG